MKDDETNQVINNSSLWLDIWSNLSQLFTNKYKNNILTIYEEHKSKTTFLSSWSTTIKDMIIGLLFKTLHFSNQNKKKNKKTLNSKPKLTLESLQTNQA